MTDFWFKGSLRHFVHLPLPRPVAKDALPSRQRGASGHAVKPIAEQLAGMDDRRLACQHQKRCLKGILYILPMVEHASADAEHHRPMPAYQRRKGGLVALAQKAVKQLPV